MQESPATTARTCKDCGKLKPLEAFALHGQSRGRKPYRARACRICERARYREAEKRRPKRHRVGQKWTRRPRTVAQRLMEHRTKCRARIRRMQVRVEELTREIERIRAQ